MWIPDLTQFTGPKYLAIADALSLDIVQGRLAPGDRLPPQRELSYALGVNFGTVTRAYALAADRGLVRGEIGRGTFVRKDPPSSLTPWPDESRTPDRIDMRSDFPCSLSDDPAFRQGFQNLPRHPDFSSLLQYQPGSARPDHQEAAAAWTGLLGVPSAPDGIFITNGALHSGFLSLLAVTRPGDTIYTESLTSPAIRSIAAMLHLTIKPVATDGQGLIPEDLEEKQKNSPARALYLVPDFQNPTTAVLPEHRRDAIAGIVENSGLYLVEDDVFGGLARGIGKDRIPGAPMPVSGRIPERAFYITSFSKGIAPGLRIGYLVPPKGFREKILTGLRITSWMASPPMAELVSGWIRDDNAARLFKRQAEKLSRLTRIAGAALKDLQPGIHDHCPHVWLRLPGPGRETLVTDALAKTGIDVTPGEYFSVSKGLAPNGIRLCLGQIDDPTRLYRACRIISRVLSSI